MKKIISEDGSKILYETDNEDEVLLKYTDDVVDNKGNVKGSVKNKATINAAIAAHIFKMLSSYHVSTFFKSQKSAKELLLKKATPLPLRLLISQEKAGDGAQTTMVKYESLGNETATAIERDEILASGLLTAQQLADVRRYALKINALLSSFFARRGLELLDFSVQFGLVNGKITVSSDFTLDTCELKDTESKTKFKKSYLLTHIDDASELYELFHRKVML
ncbi:hypothetical protein JXA02_12650 [candidate division KSB1 bacterium]|nr:hypothetical protein [candidate division KSB1 bacterium]